MDQRRKSEAGFTLIELMVVLVILGLLFGIVGPKILDTTGPKRKAAKFQIGVFEDALQQFNVENGFYPDSEQGLEALVSEPQTGREAKNWREGGYLEKNRVPLDPWDNPYVYIYPGTNGEFDILSYGPDGEPGGDGKDAADVTSWEDE